ncbi:MAG: NAD(+) synthase [Verrucomicrobiales bacterium]
MKPIHLAAAVLNQTPLDWRGNTARCRSVLDEARSRGVSLVCLPELCLTGYGCEDAFHSANTHHRAWAALRELLPDTRGLVASFGLPILHQGGVFNGVALAVDGQLLGVVAKRFLAGDGIHYEPRWFKAWPVGVRDVFTPPDAGPGDSALAIGDLLFDVGGVRMGFEICEDAWVAARPGAVLAQFGADLILNPSASHFAFGKIEVRRRFVLEGSRAFNATYVYANLLGNEAGRGIYDGDAMIATGGRLVAEGERFSFADHALTTAVIDVEATRMAQARTASFRPDLVADDALLVAAPFAWPDLDIGAMSKPLTCGRASSTAEAGWADGRDLKEEEFTRAEALALFDYMRKSRSRGFVVSLSGGADSAATACLVHLMVQLAIDDIGPSDFLDKLGYFPELTAAVGEAGEPATNEALSLALTRHLLTTAYQSTENSGPVTRAAARAVADAIGSRHFELDVASLHREYLGVIEKALGRPLQWRTDDIALQNIQARVRSPGIWMLANVAGALLLSTSNRSEAAVGYATMDGDTSGGLAPIAGIDKAFLRDWLRWLETAGPRLCDGTRVAIQALQAVTVQAPTAELRPPSASQTDEDDLMPYPLLDAIERLAIRDKRPPLEVWRLVRRDFPEHGAPELATWVERFYRLWSRNQWKRERYAPSFHLDDENLDPKTWCRWPILSGGFEVELEELRAEARRIA